AHTIDETVVLVVDRFDRAGSQRVGYVSAMTLLEANDGDERSYLDIAEVIEAESPRTGPTRAVAAHGVLGAHPQHRRPLAQPRVPPRHHRRVVTGPGVRPQPRSAAGPEVAEHGDRRALP